jgi:TctA family transporter
MGIVAVNPSVVEVGMLFVFSFLGLLMRQGGRLKLCT